MGGGDTNESAAAEKSGAGTMVTAKALQRAVADLETTRPGPGLRKTLSLAVPAVLLSWLAFTTASTLAFLACAVGAGTALAALLITTHDGIHHTLTGWRWFDELIPRLVSHPLVWTHGLFAEVHKLHHKMNGDDLADPERVQWTVEEYAAASPLRRFYVRHQWPIDIFVFGGVGLIAKNVGQAARFYRRSKGVRRQFWLDAIGIAAAQTLIYGVAISQGRALQVLSFWLILERIGGGVLQWRAHVEHYGLWGKGRHYFETQVYNCRNLRTNAVGSWFFNRLNFHSVHHAFPRVPFYALGEAHRRFQALYRAAGGEPLVDEASYLGTAWRLTRHPTLIGAPDPGSPSGRRQMHAPG